MPIDQRRLVTAAKQLARVAGVVYLLIVFLGGVARLSVRAGVPIPGYAAPTEPTGAQVSLVTDITLTVLFAFAGVTLYLLLRHVDRRVARPPVVYVAVAAGMIMVNLLFHQAAMLAATGRLSTALGAQKPGGLVALLVGMHDHGYTVAAVALCLWLVAVGHLAYQSARYPAALSILLTVSLITATAVRLLWPGLPTVVHSILAPPLPSRTCG